MKWSDGNTSPTRTDKSFKQNVNVTAMFSAKLNISFKEGSSATIKEGASYTLHVSAVGGDVTDDNVQWTVNGEKVKTGYSYGQNSWSAGTIKEGASYTLHVSAVGGDVTDDNVQWTVNGEKVKTGYSYGQNSWSAGTYDITATININGKLSSATFKLVVEAAPTPEPTAAPPLTLTVSFLPLPSSWLWKRLPLRSPQQHPHPHLRPLPHPLRLRHPLRHLLRNPPQCPRLRPRKCRHPQRFLPQPRQLPKDRAKRAKITLSPTPEPTAVPTPAPTEVPTPTEVPPAASTAPEGQG